MICQSYSELFVPMMETTNFLFVGLQDGPVNVIKETSTSSMTNLVNSLLIKGIDVSRYHFSHNGSPMDKESSVNIEISNSEQESGVVVIRAYPGARGGKGGFGALIRAMGMQINKSRSRDACRDLSGRRMRDVNAEKKLADWAKAQPEKERKKAQEKARKREMLLAGGPKHFFNDPEYMQRLEATEDNMDDALRQGLQMASSSSRGKRKATTVIDDFPSKKSKAWFGLDDDLDSNSDDLDSNSDDHDTEDESLGGGEEPCAAVSSGAGSEHTLTTCREREPELSACLESQTTSIKSGDQELQVTDQKSHAGSQTVEHQTDSQNNSRDHQTDSQTNDHECQTLSQASDQEHQTDSQSNNREPQAFSAHDSSERAGPLSADGDEKEQTAAKDDSVKPLSDESKGQRARQRAKQRANMAQMEDGKVPAASERSGQQCGADPSKRPAVSHETQPLDLDQFNSAEELVALGPDVLKLTLQQLGLKCGGTVTERAQRLFSVKGKKNDEIDRSLFAKSSKGRGKGKKPMM